LTPIEPAEVAPAFGALAVLEPGVTPVVVALGAVMPAAPALTPAVVPAPGAPPPPTAPAGDPAAPAADVPGEGAPPPPPEAWLHAEGPIKRAPAAAPAIRSLVIEDSPRNASIRA
jgi:hypothetical protein